VIVVTALIIITAAGLLGWGLAKLLEPKRTPRRWPS
jgi:hypothetical protein